MQTGYGFLYIDQMVFSLVPLILNICDEHIPFCFILCYVFFPRHFSIHVLATLKFFMSNCYSYQICTLFCLPIYISFLHFYHLQRAGNEAFQSGRYTEAVEHYTSALSINVESRPFAAICLCNRAAAHQALGQIADAIADCSLAIALDGSYSKVCLK